MIARTYKSYKKQGGINTFTFYSEDQFEWKNDAKKHTGDTLRVAVRKQRWHFTVGLPIYLSGTYLENLDTTLSKNIIIHQLHIQGFNMNSNVIMRLLTLRRLYFI